MRKFMKKYMEVLLEDIWDLGVDFKYILNDAKLHIVNTLKPALKFYFSYLYGLYDSVYISNKSNGINGANDT